MPQKGNEIEICTVCYGENRLGNNHAGFMSRRTTQRRKSEPDQEVKGGQQAQMGDKTEH